MLNGLRAKLVALATLAASFVRPSSGDSTGPEVTHHADPAFREIEIRRSRKSLARVGHEIKMPAYIGRGAPIKLLKRFAEAPYRNARGY